MLPAALALLVGGSVTLGVAYLIADYEGNLREEEMVHLSQERLRSFEDHLLDYQDVLLSIEGYYQANGNAVSRSQFAVLIKPLQQRIAGIQALEWIPRVSGKKISAFEAARGA